MKLLRKAAMYAGLTVLLGLGLAFTFGGAPVVGIPLLLIYAAGVFGNHTERE
jgi:hypothetical protein